MPTYKVVAKFNTINSDNTVILDKKSKYRTTLENTDTIIVKYSSIEIEAIRSTPKQLLIESSNNTLYKQIIKALCLYYIVTKQSNCLASVVISGGNRKRIFDGACISQPIRSSANLSILSRIDINKATIILEETPSGRLVLNAVTHLIKSLDSQSPFDRFEKLWRAFNALYKALSNKPDDHECHRYLRKFIEENPNLFPNSIEKVQSLTASEIRQKIRWNLMILNDYPGIKKTEALRDNILRNIDNRILLIHRDATISVRKNYLAAKNMLSAVNSHISEHIHKNTIRDSDVLSTLSIKYMYFVRNKIMHAEKTDHGFSFLKDRADSDEILWLTPIIEALTIDLINISDKFLTGQST